MTTPSAGARQAHEYPHRILLMVTGRTPQVVTETLYALACRPGPGERRFVPTEIHLITTAEGAQDARIALLDPKDGWFQRLCADYQLRKIAFTPDHIHVIVGADGKPAEDIRSAAEHEACADLITEQVRAFTADPTTALHVSLAGGRKTMTYYLGNALTLFGRPQDSLSHVLVPPPFESNPEFFYPTPYDRRLYSNRLERWFDAKDAEVTLAEIPFVRLRGHLPRRFKLLAAGQARFTEVVTAMQQVMEPASVVVDYRRRGIQLGTGLLVELTGADLVFYAWLARRALSGAAPVRIPKQSQKGWSDEERALYASYRDEFLAEAEHTDLRDNTGAEMRTARAMTYRFFHDRKGSIAETLEEAAGPLADAYAVRALTEGRPAGYGLSIDPERIEIVEEGYL